MHTEYLVVDHNAEGQIIEHVGEIMPHVGITVFAGTFGVEAVGLGNAARLMVAADKMNSFWIA